MKSVVMLSAFLLTSVNLPVYGHDMQYSVTHGNAVIIRLYYGDDTEFSYERFEIFRNGEDIPFQVGRTDGWGRIVFVPDCSGMWRIKAFSEDGHGLDISIEVDENDVMTEMNRPLYDRYSRIVIGIALIFGIFGISSLFFRRRSK